MPRHKLRDKNLERIVYLIKRKPTYEIGDRNPTRQDYDLVQRRIRTIPDKDTQTEWFERRWRDIHNLPYVGIYWDEAYPKYPGDNRDYWFDRIRRWWKIAALLDKILEELRYVD